MTFEPRDPRDDSWIPLDDEPSPLDDGDYSAELADSQWASADSDDLPDSQWVSADSEAYAPLLSPPPVQPYVDPSLNDDDSPAAPPRKVGRARERHQRRQQQRQPDPVRAPRRPVKPAVRPLPPPGAVTLPKIRLPKTRAPLYIVGSVLLVGFVLLVLSRFTGQEAETPPNAIWLGAEWSYNIEDQRSRALPELVDRLRAHEIGTVYAWVSWLKEDMTWAGRRDLENNFNEVQPEVAAFVTSFKEAYPSVNLYGWISVPAGTEPNGRDLSSPDVQQAVAAFSRFAVDELGFDGVFLNVEPVWDGDPNFISLLGVVRDTLGSDVPISAAIPPDWHPENPQIPVPPLIEPGTEWSADYKKSVALLVDELALMAYNSGLADPNDYADWVAYQVATYANTVSELDAGAGAGVQIMIGIPTYDSELPGHDALVENIPSAIRGVRAGVTQAGENARYISGLSLYAEWATDDVEWAQFNLNWITGEQQ